MVYTEALVIVILEIHASRVFLGANAQLLGTSLAGAFVLTHYLNRINAARLRLAQHSANETKFTNLWPLFWPSLPSKAKIDQSIFKGPSLMNPFILVYWV